MSFRKVVRILSLGLGVACIANCSSDEPVSPSNTDKQRNLIVGQIDLSAGLNEYTTDMSDGLRASLSISNLPQERKFKTQFVFSEVDTVLPVVIQLKGPDNAIYYTQVEARVTGEKSFRIHREDVQFRSMSTYPSAEVSVPTTNTDGWQARLFLGGTYDAEGAQVRYDGQTLSLGEDENRTIVQAETKYPFVSDWVSVGAEVNPSTRSMMFFLQRETDPSTQDEVQKPIQLKMMGNLLRIKITSTVEPLSISSLSFISTDVTGTSYFNLSRDGGLESSEIGVSSMSEYKTSWSGEGKMYNLKVGIPHYAYTWVRRAVSHSERKSYIDIEAYVATARASKTFRIWKKETETNIKDGVSSPLTINIGSILP